MLTVSRLDANERYKGHDETLKALSLIIKDFPTLKYIIAGDGTDRARLEAFVNSLSLNDYVIFAGRVSDNELAQLYAVCEFFIMPSKEVKEAKKLKIEGFGIVFAEAGACGKPVIGGKSGGIEEAVIDGITGLLVDTNEHSIAEAITKLLKDKPLCQKLGMEARRRVVQEMAVHKVANKIDNFLVASLKYKK
jgi:phosphatidylinositol alpha-1,6-mannosyltransferase